MKTPIGKSEKKPPVPHRSKAPASRNQRQTPANKRLAEQTRKILRTHYAKEKLTRPQRGRVAGAGAGSHFLSPSRGLRERLKFCAEAKLGKLSDQAICFDYGWTAVEMTGPEIVVFNAVF